MADIFNGIVNVIDYATFIGDADLQAMFRRAVQGTYGHFSRSIKTGAYAPSATALWLQIDDTGDIPISSSTLQSVQSFDILYYDASNPADKKYFWWQELKAENPGDGSLALHLQNSNLSAQSHTLGTGVGEFSLVNANVTYFRIFI